MLNLNSDFTTEFASELQSVYLSIYFIFTTEFWNLPQLLLHILPSEKFSADLWVYFRFDHILAQSYLIFYHII